VILGLFCVRYYGSSSHPEASLKEFAQHVLDKGNRARFVKDEAWLDWLTKYAEMT
jgi:hypothetical protein